MWGVEGGLKGGTARMGRGKYLQTDNHTIQSSVQIVGGD